MSSHRTPRGNDITSLPRIRGWDVQNCTLVACFRGDNPIIDVAVVVHRLLNCTSSFYQKATRLSTSIPHGRITLSGGGLHPQPDQVWNLAISRMADSSL